MQQNQTAPAITVAVPTLAAALTLLLAGCGGTPKQLGTANAGPGMPDAVPRVEPKAKYGNMASYVVYGKTYYPKKSSRGHVERGVASWYGKKFHGRKTSSGERYDMYQMTAAHKTLPLPTYTLVRNLENGRSAIVRVNDRGPFVGNRIIDLSYAAAKKLGVDKKGTARVEVVSIDPRDHGGRVPKLWRAAAHKRSQAGTESNAWNSATAYRQHAGSRHEPSSNRGPTPAAQTGTPGPRTAASPDPTPNPVSVPVPSPTATTAIRQVDESPLFLQVGAFGTRDNAEQLRRRLTGLLADRVQVQEADHRSTSTTISLYRVRIGPLASRSRADALSRKLTTLGIDRPLVVGD